MQPLEPLKMYTKVAGYFTLDVNSSAGVFKPNREEYTFAGFSLLCHHVVPESQWTVLLIGFPPLLLIMVIISIHFQNIMIVCYMTVLTLSHHVRPYSGKHRP